MPLIIDWLLPQPKIIKLDTGQVTLMSNDLCWCFSVAASGVWEFPPQGLNSRLKSWGSCTHPQSYSKRLKVGHNSGLLLLTHAN